MKKLLITTIIAVLFLSVPVFAEEKTPEPVVKPMTLENLESAQAGDIAIYERMVSKFNEVENVKRTKDAIRDRSMFISGFKAGMEAREAELIELGVVKEKKLTKIREEAEKGE